MKRLYCPCCSSYEKHTVFRGETIRAFRCETCRTVEEWDWHNLTIELRPESKS